jgi:hypothetical protein
MPVVIGPKRRHSLPRSASEYGQMAYHCVSPPLILGHHASGHLTAAVMMVAYYPSGKAVTWDPPCHVGLHRGPEERPRFETQRQGPSINMSFLERIRAFCVLIIFDCR